MSTSKLARLFEELKDEARRGYPRRQEDPAGRELEVRALAERVFGDESKADAWLRRPNSSLSGQVPLDLLKDEIGTAVVRETLEQIDHGIFA